MNRRQFLSAAFLVALSAKPVVCRAANNSAMISIQVTDMHCATCASKIARKIYAVPGVVRVDTNLQQHRAWITPQQAKSPSLRAVWEAVEKAGFKPVRLDGPTGSFSSKPAT